MGCRWKKTSIWKFVNNHRNSVFEKQSESETHLFLVFEMKSKSKNDWLRLQWNLPGLNIPICSVQSVQSKKVFILRVTVKIGVLLGFVKESIDCPGCLHSMFYKMLAHLWQQWSDFKQLLNCCKIRKNLKCF
jgi:hypothetical protein